MECVSPKTTKLGVGTRCLTIACNRKCKCMYMSREGMSGSSAVGKRNVRRAFRSGRLGGKASGYSAFRFITKSISDPKNTEASFNESAAEAWVSQSKTAEVVRLWLLLLFVPAGKH